MKIEHKFVKECLKAFLGKNKPDVLYNLYSKINLKRLVDFILEHKLEGLFYYLYLNNTFKNINIPYPTIQIWKTIAGKNSIQNTLNDHEALEIIKILESSKLDYVYIKGFSIRHKCYPEDYIKASTDIDLFINKTDYQKVKEILTTKGYKIPYKHYRDNFRVRIPFDEYEKHVNEISFVKNQEAVKFIVDLQWDFTFSDNTSFYHDLYCLDSFYRLDNTKFFYVDGNRVEVFPRETELINIAFHYGFIHGFKGMQWLIDICTYIRKYKKEINWESMAKTANPNLKKIVGIALLLAADYNDWSKITKQEKEKFSIDRLLPLEYWLYKKMSFRTPRNSVINKLYLRLVMILLPYKLKDRLRVIKYLLFNINSIKQKIGPSKKIRKALLPFYIIKILFSEIIKERN